VTGSRTNLGHVLPRSPALPISMSRPATPGAPTSLRRLLTRAACCGGLLLLATSTAPQSSGFFQVSYLPDLSGLEYAGMDVFVAVHDAKDEPAELNRPRVSLVMSPQDPRGVLWKPLRMDWPTAPSNDLESVARIGGSDRYLLCESGDDDPNRTPRIFRARLAGNEIDIETEVDWPVPISNVEATAVARVQNQLYFLYAERADNQPSTQLSWAPFNPGTLQFGAFQSVTLDNPDPQNMVRGVVGLDVDQAGRIYTVASFDPEAAGLPGDPDFGPFRSSVWRVGRIRPAQGSAAIDLDPEPTRVATIDGFKTESVTLGFENQQPTLYVGFDDENYGGTLRPLLPVQ